MSFTGKITFVNLQVSNLKLQHTRGGGIVWCVIHTWNYNLASIIKFLVHLSQQPEMTLGIVAHKWQKSAGDDWSTLTLKPMDIVIQSPKQRVPVVPQNGPRSNKNLKKKKNQ